MADSGGRLRVVYVNSAADVGGGERYMLSLVDHLDRQRYESLFVVPYRGAFLDDLRRRGLEPAVIDMRRLVNPVALVVLVRHLRRLRPQLVHTAGARAGFYGRLAARLARVPAIVSTVHNSIGAYEVSAARRALYRRLDRATARFAQRIICTSRAATQDLIERGGVPAAKVVTVPTRPDPRRLTPTRARAVIRAELGIADDIRVLGGIGRLTAQKGFGDLLDALARLIGRDDWRCVLAGDGPLRGALEARCRRLGLGDRCRFLGMRADVGDLLAALDVFVVPSIYEGMPYVVLEAMLVGLPLVATQVGGIPEVIEDGVTGVLVPPRAPDILATAIGALLDDRSRRAALADAARAWAARECSLPAMVSAVEQVYAAALREAGVGPARAGATVRQ